MLFTTNILTNLNEIHLRSETTEQSLGCSSVIVGHVVVVRDHDVAVLSIGEGVPVGLVEVASASGVSGRAVVKLIDVGGGSCGG